jgi:hypothetical protein
MMHHEKSHAINSIPINVSHFVETLTNNLASRYAVLLAALRTTTATHDASVSEDARSCLACPRAAPSIRQEPRKGTAVPG